MVAFSVLDRGEWPADVWQSGGKNHSLSTIVVCTRGSIVDRKSESRSELRAGCLQVLKRRGRVSETFHDGDTIRGGLIFTNLLVQTQVRNPPPSDRVE